MMEFMARTQAHDKYKKLKVNTLHIVNYLTNELIITK